MPDRRAHWRPRALTGTPPAPTLRVTNALGTDGGTATLYVYAPLDEMGAEWGGVSAAEFVAALNTVQAAHLDLRVNSPGGSFFEAVTARAALVAHPARVTAYVDGLAASAASVLITGADKVIMSRGSQQMIHCASTLAIGNAAQLRADADLLEKVDRDIAGFYVERSGQGTAESWLTAMAQETWMSADEAVAAGLADEIAADPVRTRDEQVPVAAAVDHWILATYRYAGRGEAPSPVTASTEGPTAAPMSATELAETSALLDEPEPNAAEAPALTQPLLDDDAVARIAEAVAERLAARTTPAPTPEAAPIEAAPSETPAPPAPQVAPVAAAPPPLVHTTVEALAPQFDPALFRAAIRKAAS